MNENTKIKTVSSLIWKFIESAGTQGIQFIVTIILARLLLPEEYGIIALVTVFISLAQVFVQSGFNTALIQRKNADEVDFSSVFYFSFVFAAFLYIILFFVSPLIAEFYENNQLIPVLRVLSITLFLGAFNSIQNAFIARNMMFDKLFYSSIIGVIISGLAGVFTAYAGWGVWALVTQTLLNQITVTIIMLFTIKWRPICAFSFIRLKGLFIYGSKILATNLLDTLYRELRSLIIGKLYAPSMLGLYNRGEQFPKLIINNINGSIQSVIFPILSTYQDDPKRVKEILKKAIMTSSFFVFPIMVGLAAVAEPMVKIILTEKWLPMVPFLRIFCVSFALWPIHTANLQAISAMGHSEIVLKLTITKKIIGLIILGISLPFGVYAIAWGVLLNTIVSTFINAYPNSKLLKYSFKEQLHDILPSLLIAIVMGLCVFLFSFLSIKEWEILVIQLIVGVILYTLLAKIFKIEIFGYLIGLASYLSHKFKKQSV